METGVLNGDNLIKPFRLTFSDYLAVNLQILFLHFISWPSGLFWLGVPMLLVRWLAWPHIERGDTGAAFQTGGIILLIWFAGIPLFAAFRVWHLLRRTPSAYAINDVRVDQGGLNSRNETSSVSLDWAAFRSVHDVGRYLFLQLHSGSGQILPKTAFQEQSDVKRFVVYVRTQLQAAKRAQNPVPVEDKDLPLLGQGMASPPFVLTFDTYTRYYARLSYESFKQPVKAGLVVFVLAGASVWLNASERWPMGPIGVLIWMFIELAAAVIFLAFVACLGWSRIQDRASTKGKRRIAITPEGFQAKGTGYETTLEWDKFRNVIEGFGVILFLVKPFGAITLPVSAFADKAAADAFYQAALGYFQAAKTGAAKTTLDGGG